MNNIEFPSHLLKKANLNKLIFLSLLEWFYIFSLTYIALKTNYLLYPLWALLLAGRYHALGVIMHEHAHLNLRDKPVKMRFLELVSSYVLGSSVNAISYHHLRHHKFTGLKNDPYIKLVKLPKNLKTIFIIFFHGTLFFPFIVLKSFMSLFAFKIKRVRVFYGKFFLLEKDLVDFKNSPEIVSCIKEDMPVGVLQVLIAVISYLYFPEIIYFYYLPITVTGILSTYRLISEHHYDFKEVDQDQMMSNTFDHHVSLFDQLFIAPLDVGFHYIHHLHPSAPFYNLRKIQSWYLKNSEEYWKIYGYKR